MRLLIFGLFSAIALAQTTPPIGSWTAVSTAGGYPPSAAGYDACTYNSTHNWMSCFVNYLTIGVTSEGQDAMMHYSYPENRWFTDVTGGGWHGPHRSPMGHQMGIQFNIPLTDTLYWQANYSYGNDVDQYPFMFGLDNAGMTVFELPFPTSSSNSGLYTAVWMQSTSGLLSASAWDTTTSKLAVFPDYRGGTGQAQLCTLSGQAFSCATTSATNGPTANGNGAMVAVSGTAYWLGGGDQQMYLLNYTTGLWSKPTTTCAGPDCSGSAPAARYGEGMDWDPDTNLIWMMAGETTSGGGSIFQETWTFNTSTFAWNEICGPGLNSAACAGFTYVVTVPGSRMTYDTVDHVHMWVPYASSTVSMYAPGVAGGGVAPLAYGRTSNTYSPTAGSLNITSPSGTSQGWASDPSISISGSTITIAHEETGTPTTGGNCQVSVDYFLQSAYLPTGGLAAACAAIGHNNNQEQPSDYPFTAQVGGSLWQVEAKQRVSPYWGETQSIVFSQAYNSGTGKWQVPTFPAQTPTCSTCGSAGSNVFTLSPFPTNIGATATKTLVYINDISNPGNSEYAPVTAVNSGASQITVLTNHSHSGSYTIQDSGWLGCFTSNCDFTVGSPNPPQSYPQGILNVGGVPTVLLIEQVRSIQPPPTNLYVVQPGSAGYTVLGSSKLNVTSPTSPAQSAINSASFDTDGSGNIGSCFAEMTVNSVGGSRLNEVTTTPQIQCKLWNGSSWSRMGSASLNLTSTDWAYNPSTKFFNGSFYVAFTERSATGNPNLYAFVYNSGSNTWTQIGSSLNNNSSTGIAYHPSLAADGTTALYLGWEEQSAAGQHALGYLRSTTGSSWSAPSAPFAADTTNGSVENVSIVANSGTVTATWSELKYGNQRQLYSAALSLAPTWSTTLTIQEALIGGANGFSGLARTNEPVTVGIPIPDADALTNLSTLGLSSPFTAGQFTCEANWPDGFCKWVKIRGIVSSVSSGGSVTATFNNSGSGNFGGSNLATDNGSTITVATGTATFTIKKANFNVVDSVVIGATTVVSSGASGGLVVLGPVPTGSYPSTVTCSPTSGGSPCATVYSTVNDGSSTCTLEENGPAVAVLKCTADLIDGAAHTYMHTTTREYFFQNRSQMKYTVALRNADYGTSSTFATASKGFQGFEMRITPNISGTLTYKVANDTGTPTSGSMSGTDTTYLYQAESNLAKSATWCNGTCQPPSPISGWAIMNNGSALLTGTVNQYPSGWADIANGSGVGVLIGQDQLAAYGNKSLEFRAGGSDVRIGMWASQNNTTGPSITTANQPYYIPWPQWSIQNGWLEFHATAPASPVNDHLKLQYPLLARAPYTWYNTAGVFPEPLLDPTEETNYYTATLSAANPAVSAVSALDSVMGDASFSDKTCSARGNGSIPSVCIFRYWVWGLPAGSNQMEARLSNLYNFIRRGFTGQYMESNYWYKWIAEDAFPMSDGFKWTSHAAQTQYFGFPTATSDNAALSISGSGGRLSLNIQADMEHSNAQGYDTFYLMSGDETMKDSYMEAVPPFFANNTSSNNYTTVSPGLYNDRSAGNLFKWAAHLYTFLNSVGDSTDANTILANAETVYTVRLQPNLCAYPNLPNPCTPDISDNIPQVGTTQVRGLSNIFKDTSYAYDGVACGASWYPSTYQGAWSNTTNYSLNQVVSYNGELWVSGTNNNVNDLPNTGPNFSATSVSNANPAVLTFGASTGYANGTILGAFVVNGGTGPWAAINGTYTGTAIVLSPTTISIPVNSSALGALTGTITAGPTFNWGEVAPRTAKPFMSSRKLEGMGEFYNIVPNSWSLKQQFWDYMYGTTQWNFSEMLADDGTNVWTGNSLRYAMSIDNPNGCNTTGDWGQLGNVETIWYHWTTLEKYLGPLSAQKQRILAQVIQRDSSNGNIDEFYHNTMATAIYYSLHPQTGTLATTAITSFVDNGGGSYTIGWTTPPSTTQLRVKWGPLQIVDLIGFNAGTYAFVGNPATTQNWFASTDASSIPAPVTGTQTMTIATGTTGLSSANFMVKAMAPSGSSFTGGTGIVSGTAIFGRAVK